MRAEMVQRVGPCPFIDADLGQVLAKNVSNDDPLTPCIPRYFPLAFFISMSISTCSANFLLGLCFDQFHHVELGAVVRDPP